MFKIKFLKKIAIFTLFWASVSSSSAQKVIEDPMVFTEEEALRALIQLAGINDQEDAQYIDYIHRQFYMATYNDILRAGLGVLQSEKIQQSHNYFSEYRQYWGSTPEIVARPWLRLAACIYTRFFAYDWVESRRKLIEEYNSNLEGIQSKVNFEYALDKAVEGAFLHFECDKNPSNTNSAEAYRVLWNQKISEAKRTGRIIQTPESEDIDTLRPFM